MMPPLLSLSIAVPTGNTSRRINLTTCMTSTTSPQTPSVKNILRSYRLTNLFPSLSHFCCGHAMMMQKSWTPGPWRALTLALTARILTIGSPSHKGFQSQPANGLYLQSPKLLERNDAIHIIYHQTQNPSKSLNLIYRYLQYPHPHFWFTHVSTSMQYIFQISRIQNACLRTCPKHNCTYIKQIWASARACTCSGGSVGGAQWSNTKSTWKGQENIHTNEEVALLCYCTICCSFLKQIRTHSNYIINL